MINKLGYIQQVREELTPIEIAGRMYLNCVEVDEGPFRAPFSCGNEESLETCSGSVVPPLV